MKSHFSPLLILLLILLSCKKDKVLKQEIVGSVSAKNINSRASEAGVSVYSKKLTSSSINNSFTLIGTTITDAQGNFEISFERARTAEYKIVVEKDDFFSTDIRLSSDLVEKTTRYSANIAIFPKAEVELIISNLPPALPGNYLGFKATDEVACACCFPDGFTYRGTGDTTIICDWYGAQNFRYKYTKSNEEGLKQVFDSTFLVPFESNTIQINF